MIDESEPRSNSNHTPIRVFRMNNDDYAMVRKAADLNQQNFSDFARVALLEGAQQILSKKSRNEVDD